VRLGGPTSSKVPQRYGIFSQVHRETRGLSMKIVLLAPPNVEGYYTASLLVRGFKAVTIPAVAPVLDFPKLKLSGDR
jgi:hypothetical protein